MKYGFTPTNPGEAAALLAGQVPLPLIDSVFGLLKVRCLMAAVSLEVFEALRDGPSAPAQLAGRTGLDAGALELLLRVLAFFGYIALDGDRFSLTGLSRRALLAGAPQDQTGYVLWNYTQWEFAEHLEELLRTGKGLDFHHTMTDQSRWGHYQRGMLELARFDAPVIARGVPVKPGAARLLDVAGSHGLFGAAICRRHPPMRSTVLDLPAAIEHARALAQSAGHGDLVDYRAGDLLADDLGSGWDVVLLSNILHHFSPEQNEQILRRVKSATSAGGTVAIWELERPKNGASAGPGDVAGLLFRLSSNASTYGASDYEGWLERAGFREVRSLRSLLSPGNVLVVGRC